MSTRRQEPTSPLRRATQVVLGAGTALAVASAFGPVWVVRIGLVVSVAAGVLACSLAWRELFAARRQHAGAMLRASHQHGAVLHEERERNAAVVEALSERARSAGMVIAGQRVTIAQLRSEVEQRDGVIGSLRGTVAAHEDELQVLRTRDDAELHHLPRRVLTVADTEGAVDLRTLETAMVLPNYEGPARRVG